jgi:hypothetical protein
MCFVRSNLQFLDLFFCHPLKVGNIGVLIITILVYDVKCKLIAHVRLIKTTNVNCVAMFPLKTHD